MTEERILIFIGLLVTLVIGGIFLLVTLVILALRARKGTRRLLDK